MTSPRRALLPAAAALVILITGCSSGDSASDSTAASSVSTADTASIAGFNDADVEFAQGMIARHEQAIEMAEIAADPNVGARTEVVDLAKRIRAAQEPEVAQMTTWLNAAGKPLTMDMSDGHDMSAMPGMMSSMQLDMLAAAKGADFDTMWIEMMIDHHEGAVLQAGDVIENGTNAELAALARQIIAVQEKELVELRALLTR